MNDLPDRTARRYGVSGHLYIVIGIFGTILLAPAISLGWTKGDWTGVYLFGGIIVSLLAMLQLIRFKIGPDGFIRRTPLSAETIDFADVTRAYFIVTYGTHSPQGVGDFCLQTKDGKEHALNVRIYSVSAAADLFDELDRHGIPIEVPDLWGANRLVKEIRRAQAKLRAKSGA